MRKEPNYRTEILVEFAKTPGFQVYIANKLSEKSRNTGKI